MKRQKAKIGLSTFLAVEYKNLIQFIKRSINERYYNISAEDIIQDVALNLFSKLDIDSQVENVAGYFYRSLRNRIVDIRSKPKNEILFEEFNDDEDDNVITDTLVDGEGLEFREINDKVFYEKFYEALNRLNPNQREVIIATEMDGYSFEELSEEWDIPIGTLLSWKHRGIKKIKEFIKLDDFYKETVDY